MSSLAFAFSITLFIAQQPVRGSSCEDLASIPLPHTRITSAQVVGAGKFTSPGAEGGALQFAGLPAFCRVTATSKPTSESEIKIDVWLPISGWNGKFQPGSLGAGLPGGIRYGAVAAILKSGYATGCDDLIRFARGHDEQAGSSDRLGLSRNP
jgi:feruloyl esterase